MTSSPQPADGTWSDPAAEPTEPTAGASQDDGSPDDSGGDGRRRRPLRASLITLAALTVVAAGGVGATGVLGGDGGESAEAAPARPAKSATVEKTTLTRSETVDGALGYGEATTVQAPATGGSGESGTTGAGTGTQGGDTGTVTWLPDVGDKIERGESVYSADERKAVLLYGSTPLYRTLGVGSEGKDVTMLERNLAALGHTGFTVDGEYTESTADAVRAWQEDLGREETGEVAPDDAVVASGARRVAEVKSARGAALSGDVLTWTGTERVVTVDLEVRHEGLVKGGTKATVALPDGTVVDAKVTDIGAAATAAPSEGGEDTSAEDATLPVELTVKDQKKLGRYQAAPVDVTLTAERRADVLAVPVNALIARQGGGYAVQVITDDGVENRPVELGLFADGLVEVSGTAITEGLRVGVPQ
ncbi:peptidoglycan-binding domain-containing protein [Streptomyces niveus]|uniref:peptidoglycan-binding protein n=1 Tax=Streptomyces niveus TaxID=193462 RepID=UPI00386C255B|nr:peptidoglycan-binding domain-containing protein [Streptomyces niveus]